MAPAASAGSSAASTESAAQQDNLRTLAHRLQAQLRTLLGVESLPLRCTLYRGKLLIMGQHSRELKIDAQEAFVAMEDSIQTQLSEFVASLDPQLRSQRAKVKLYLRYAGTREPYASHSFKLRPDEPESELMLALEGIRIPEVLPDEVGSDDLGEDLTVAPLGAGAIVPAQNSPATPPKQLVSGDRVICPDETDIGFVTEHSQEFDFMPSDSDIDDSAGLNLESLRLDLSLPESMHLSQAEQNAVPTPSDWDGHPAGLPPLDLDLSSLSEVRPDEDLVDPHAEELATELASEVVMEPFVDQAQALDLSLGQELEVALPPEESSEITPDLDLEISDNFDAPGMDEAPAATTRKWWQRAAKLPATPSTSASSAAIIPYAGSDAETPDLDRDSAPAPASKVGKWAWILSGATVAIASFSGSLWAVRQPCVVGGCEPVETSQALLQKLPQLSDEGQLPQLQEQLGRSAQDLVAIPVWSSWHGQAQDLLRQQAPHSQALELLLKAQQTSLEASDRSKNPQESPQSILALRQAAIGHLEALPPESPFRDLASRRLEQLRRDMAQSADQGSRDQQASQQLSKIKGEAQATLTRQGITQDVEGWKAVQLSWQTAIADLKRIPKTSKGFTEAQQLTATYQKHLNGANARIKQLESAQNALQQAQSLAQTAQAEEQQGKSGLQSWTKALKAAQQVPKQSPLYESAQKLIPAYTLAVQKAEARTQADQQLQQQTRTDLAQICAGTPKICTYSVTEQEIRLQLTSEYEKSLKSAVSASQADSQTMGGTMTHLNALQGALQTLSTQAQKRLVVYSANQKEVVGSFNP
jgi:hypothetical protein